VSFLSDWSTRDKELQLQVEEEQKRERELHRKDAALKAKLAAEARVRASLSHVMNEWMEHAWGKGEEHACK
jgi:hypothetical protein